jgi:hypothetical protein
MDDPLSFAIAVPILFWMLDTLIKVLGSFSVEDVGCDLCLIGITFNATTLLNSRFSQVALLALAASFVFYVFSLAVVSPSRRNTWPKAIAWFRSLRNRANVIIGGSILLLAWQVYLFKA